MKQRRYIRRKTKRTRRRQNRHNQKGGMESAHDFIHRVESKAIEEFWREWVQEKAAQNIADANLKARIINAKVRHAKNEEFRRIMEAQRCGGVSEGIPPGPEPEPEPGPEPKWHTSCVGTSQCGGSRKKRSRRRRSRRRRSTRRRK